MVSSEVSHGCDLAPDCLQCPFALCQYELPSKQEKYHNRFNDNVWVQALLCFDDLSLATSDAEAAAVADLPQRYGAELRTAARWIRARMDSIEGVRE